jgi:hypothetical protein
MTAHDDWPDGLAQTHFQPVGLFTGHANPLPALVLGALLLVALSGNLGGGPEKTFAATGDAAMLRVETPAIARNGEAIETRLVVEARQPIADLKLAVDASLWRGMAQSSMIPQAADETMKDDRYIYSFGPLEAGKRLVVQIDSQSNPTLLGSTRGVVSVAVCETELVSLPLSMKVLP